MWGGVVALALLWVLACTPLQQPKLRLRNDLHEAVRAAPMAPAKAVEAQRRSSRQMETLSSKTFVIGVNAAVDLIVPALPLLEALNASTSSVAGKPGDLPALSSIDDLSTCFAHHFAHGAAAERFFANEAVFQRIVEVARSLEDTAAYTGGNAALMADFLATETRFRAHEVLLAARVGPQLKRLLRPGIQVPVPFLDAADEFHIIMEYHRGDVWGNATAPQANRFIFSHDRTNAELRAVSILQQLLHGDDDAGNASAATPGLFADTGSESSRRGSGKKQHTFVLSGVHMLEGQSENAQAASVKRLVHLLDALPSNVPVHLELASISDNGLMALAVKRLLPRVTSLGLNEQELAFLLPRLTQKDDGGFTATTGRHLKSRPKEAVQHLKRIFTALGADSKLSRVHFHCLTYHVVASHQGHWSPARAAAAAGSLAASRRACEEPQLRPHVFDILLSPTTAKHRNDWEIATDTITHHTDGLYEFAIAPVLVCNRPTKTVGLGDTISAAGLEFSMFIP